MADVIMYETGACPYCAAARRLFEKKSVAYTSIVVDSREVFAEMQERSGGRDTVLKIFIGDRHIGGYDDMMDLEMDDELDPLLQA